MLKINIVGIGPGNELSMTKEAFQAIARSSVLIGDKRVLTPFIDMGKSIVHSSSVPEIKDFLITEGKDSEVSILVSGDVGFYSLAKSFMTDDQGIGQVNLICGISSLQYFCSKLHTAWDDVVTVSLHGRNEEFIDRVMSRHKVFVLTGGQNTPANICRTLCSNGLGDLEVSVGENLSYPNEKITTDKARNLVDRTFSSLSTIMIINHEAKITKEAITQSKQRKTKGVVTHGLPDELFYRGEVPMTKQEIRAISLAKLQLQKTDIVFDIGAGTGSVAVEIALQAVEGRVYAIEKKQDALELIRQNKEKFGTDNLSLIVADAPEGLDELPAPAKVFIGGHGGNLQSILDTVLNKNPDVRIVINAITLETLHDTLSYFRPKCDIGIEIVNISVSKAKMLGHSNLMMAQNPVYIITAQRE